MRESALSYKSPMHLIVGVAPAARKPQSVGLLIAVDITTKFAQARAGLLPALASLLARDVALIAGRPGAIASVRRRRVCACAPPGRKTGV